LGKKTKRGEGSRSKGWKDLSVFSLLCIKSCLEFFFHTQTLVPLNHNQVCILPFLLYIIYFLLYIYIIYIYGPKDQWEERAPQKFSIKKA
jgi:hypothetical protein